MKVMSKHVSCHGNNQQFLPSHCSCKRKRSTTAKVAVSSRLRTYRHANDSKLMLLYVCYIYMLFDHILKLSATSNLPGFLVITAGRWSSLPKRGFSQQLEPIHRFGKLLTWKSAQFHTQRVAKDCNSIKSPIPMWPMWNIDSPLV